MTHVFVVETTRHFDRLFRKLAKQHPELPGHLAAITPILRSDPFNISRKHPIKKLINITDGNGAYRIRQGRFRFRYDVEIHNVYLKRCSLRREDTYQ